VVVCLGVGCGWGGVGGGWGGVVGFVTRGGGVKG